MTSNWLRPRYCSRSTWKLSALVRSRSSMVKVSTTTSSAPLRVKVMASTSITTCFNSSRASSEKPRLRRAGPLPGLLPLLQSKPQPQPCRNSVAPASSNPVSSLNFVAAELLAATGIFNSWWRPTVVSHINEQGVGEGESRYAFLAQVTIQQVIESLVTGGVQAFRHDGEHGAGNPVCALHHGDHPGILDNIGYLEAYGNVSSACTLQALHHDHVCFLPAFVACADAVV